MRNNRARYWLVPSVIKCSGIPALITLFILSFFHPIFAVDWADNYLPRPEDSADLSHVIATVETATRQIVSLNGEWQARKEEAAWQKVSVPGAYLFEGEMEFKRSFVLDSSLSNRSFKLVAFGINNRSTFFINGQFIGSHVGGHTAFSLEIDRQHLRIGQPNEIQVRTDNSLRARNSIPLKHSPRRAYNYGGIFRDIFIVVLPNVYIDDLVVHQKFDEAFAQCQLRIEAKIRNKLGRISADSLSLQLHAEVWDAEKKRLVGSADPVDIVLSNNVVDIRGSFSLSGFELWTPENPRLYELRVSLRQGRNKFDEYILKTGFNRIDMAGNQLLLNGKKIAIRGVDLIEDVLGSGPAVGWNALRDQILQVMELGINAIRVIGAPPHPFMPDICDELGIFLLEGMPLVLVPDERFGRNSFVELATNYFKELVARDAFHPSVLAWGLGNDLHSDADNTKTFLRSLRTIARARSNRPVFLVFHNLAGVQWAQEADFLLFEGFGKEPALFLAMLDKYARDASGKPLMGSYGYPYLLKDVSPTQTNGQVGATRLTPVQVRYQEIQANKLRQTLLREDLKGKLAGVFVHTLRDWKEAKPNLFFGTNKDPRINTSGLLSLEQERRFSYEVITSELKRNQHIQIPVHDLEEAHPVVFPIFGIIVILVFLFNFNRSRSLRGNMRRIFVYPHGFYMELKEKRKISPSHTFLLSLVACAVFGVIFASTAYHLRQNTIFNEFLSLVIGSNGLKLQIIRLIWHPLISLLFATAAVYLVFGMIILFLKIAAFVFGRDLPLIQFVTLVFWTSANFVWLLPIIPIYYRIVNDTTWAGGVMALVFVFTFWWLVRLFRATRVVFGADTGRTMILFAVIAAVSFSILGFYYQGNYAFFDYLPTYLSFATAHYF